MGAGVKACLRACRRFFLCLQGHLARRADVAQVKQAQDVRRTYVQRAQAGRHNGRTRAGEQACRKTSKNRGCARGIVTPPSKKNRLSESGGRAQGGGESAGYGYLKKRLPLRYGLAVGNTEQDTRGHLLWVVVLFCGRGVCLERNYFVPWLNQSSLEVR